jgi:hypothetical protein
VTSRSKNRELTGPGGLVYSILKINEIFTSVKTVILPQKRHIDDYFYPKKSAEYLTIKNCPCIIIRKKYLCAPNCSESDFCDHQTHTSILLNALKLQLAFGCGFVK